MAPISIRQAAMVATRLNIGLTAPHRPPLMVYASADTVWLIGGTEVAAEIVVEPLP
jgi:hypothetical protein